MLVIPAIDIRDGKCVRLIQGDYEQQRTYDADPLGMAQSFADAGAQIVHIVDLDGAKAGTPQNWELIEALARQNAIPIEFGGGVRSLETARRLLDLGIERVVVGTKLIQDPELAAELFTLLGEGVVAGIDCRDGNAATHGWLDQSEITAVELAQGVEAQGAKRLILTDIARDGMLSGPNLDLLRQVAAAVSIPVIQSGGIGSMDHLRQVKQVGVAEGVIVGRALYEGQVNLKEACSELQ